jgi:hypothetical protein
MQMQRTAERLEEAQEGDVGPETERQLRDAREGQQKVINAQEDAIGAESELRARLSRGQGRIQLAAQEAAAILEQLPRRSIEWARHTFEYPVYDRATESWGTVHFEPGGSGGWLSAVIRFTNTNAELLKMVATRLVDRLFAHSRELLRAGRMKRVVRWLRQRTHDAWYDLNPLRAEPVEFELARVLAADTGEVAFSGKVVGRRSLRHVLRERRGEVKIATVFLSLGVLLLLVTSPLALDFDERIHNEGQTWHSGWLAWTGGNLSRISTALFVAVFLPVISLLLHWRDVRRSPSIEWHV